jgi:prevent-host-death family protein
MQVNVLQAKTQLSRLIESAENGEEVVIARAGRPAVRLVPIHPPARQAHDPAAVLASLEAEGLLLRGRTTDGVVTGGRGAASLAEVLSDLSASREDR